MKKFILIPDSFKGTMSSAEVCDIMRRAILAHFPDAETISVPVADGGEGSVDAFLTALGGEKVVCTVKGPHGHPAESFYGLIHGGKTAVIEMAAAAGLPMMGDALDVLGATTYGVGELLLRAAKSGAEKIVMGLGGSATNDGGCGAAAACGVKFYDADGNTFVPVGATLANIAKIDASGLDPALRGITIETMCDIDNPMYGESGAAYVFAPQKGADTQEKITILDNGLRHLASIISRDLGITVDTIPGAGAAGAMGAGMVAFFGSVLKMGIETVLDTVDFDTLLKNADLVLSGEGRIDSQSVRGKVVVGIGRRAKKQNVPLIAIVGDIGTKDDDGDMTAVYAEGVTAVVSINRIAVPFKEAKPRAKNDLYHTVDDLMRVLKIGR